MKFDKFLKKLKEEPPAAVEAKPKRQGRPFKPDHLLKEPRRTGPRYNDKKRVKPSQKKRNNAGYKHYLVKRKRMREEKRRARARGSYVLDQLYMRSLRRKYVQNRYAACLRADRLNIPRSDYYQLTYAEWLLMWKNAPKVFRDGAFHEASALQNNPVRLKNDCTYVTRLDSTKPYRADNMAVFYRGAPLK